MDNARVFGSITKFEKQADGTLYVEGVASSESKDSQGEIVKASAIKAALPDYLKFPALREMHQLIAAGKTLAADVSEDGKTYIACKVVDPIAVKKVEEGVYKGFSIGGSVPPGGRSKDDPKIIEQLKLSEISLVDRPANPDCVVTLYKAEAEPAQAAPVQTSGSAEPVAKGMGTVAWAASLCGDLSMLANETKWEAEYEGDGSPIPGRVKAVCAEMCAILRDLVAEETAELTADQVAAAEQPGSLKKSEKFATLARAFLAAAKGEPAEKRGAKFSKSTAAALKKCHGMIQDCDKAMGALGYDKVDDDDVADAAEIGELRKSVAAAEDATKQAGDALKKVLAERDTAQAELVKTTAALAEAKVRLEQKGVLKIVPVEKKDDVAVAEAAKKFDELPAHEQVKEIHKAGGRRIA